MRKCQNCDVEFMPGKWHPHQKNCSSKCAKYVIGRRRFGLGPKKEKLKCHVCDKIFTQTRLNNTMYCNHLCKKLAASRRHKGLPINGPKLHIKGSGYITNQGYKMISKNHPNAKCRSPLSGKGQILEHIWIMSNFLKRPLMEKETVHHKNGIRNDNRIENLELWSSSHPPGQRVEDKIEWCKDFLKTYGFDVIKKIN